MIEPELVTIERIDDRWTAIIWGRSRRNAPIKLASGAGASDQAALQNARGVLKRREEERLARTT